MTVKGVDYAWGHPGAKAVKDAGFKFVCRYYSHDSSKNLHLAEAQEMSKAGISIVSIWETTAKRALSGYSGGVEDAKAARAQGNACHMPTNRPIYFAVDWDAQSTRELNAIQNYLNGAASVLGRKNVGLYAGYVPIRSCFNAGVIEYGWQTYAWSNRRWDNRAQLRQYSNDHVLHGVGVDYDEAEDVDYGQWRIGMTNPPPKPPKPKSVPIPKPALAEDGIDGKETWKATQRVLNYRNNAGLNVDGIPGHATIKALQDALNKGKL